MTPLSILLATAALAPLFAPRPARAGARAAVTYGRGTMSFALATGSPGELGLVGLLGEAFSRRCGAALGWVKAGTGEALALLKAREVDMAMVHAPARVDRAVREGWAVKKTLIGSNEFFIVGPPADPAGIGTAGSAIQAYRNIAQAQARTSVKFFSRGDDSGTHQKEMAVWKAAGITPSGPWYIAARDFMTAVLRRAEAEGGYFMTDSSTWVAEKRNLPGLKILFSGDAMLVNIYHALALPEGATPGAGTAAAFIDFVASGEGQDIIRNFGRAEHGEPIYNDAEYAGTFGG